MDKKKRNNLIIVAMLTLATLLIAFCLPNRGYRALVYSEGKPWGNAMLTAPFDIPIEYDSVTARQIRDSIDANFIKIYRRDAAVAQAKVGDLSRAMQGRADITPEAKRIVVAQVAKIYERGIVSNATADLIRQGKMPNVRILSDQVASVVPTSDMMSASEAFTYLDTVLTLPQYHHALIAVGVDKYLEPNIKYDASETQKLLTDAYQKALAPRGIVQTGESIIFPGNIVTPQKYSILQTYEKMMRQRQMQNRGLDFGFLGQIIFIAIMMVVFYVFLRVMQPDTFASLRMMVFLISFTTLFIVMVELVIGFRPNFVYIIPFALLPIIITTFSDTRTAFFLHMVVVTICSLVAKDQAEFIIMQFLAGNIAIVSVQEFSRRSQLARCAFWIFLCYSTVYAVLYLMREGNFEHIIAGRNWHVFLMFAINCAVLSSAYLLIFVVEKIFGFTSSVTLVELSDINSPLLRELADNCPGTFQHSLQVANLAAEAAHDIHANVQLVRAGALYHDIGKIDNPQFFTENQHGVNPHDGLTPEVSASIVIRHVTDGVRRANKKNLPKVIKDCILQHHGRGVARYFYATACKAHPDEKVDPAPFTYPGPNPQSRETAILMMCDGCEAAVKSLDEPSEADIAAMVHKVISSQVKSGLLNEAPISFKEIGIVQQSITKRLQANYHVRIKYPDDVKPPQEASAADDDDDPAAQ